MLAAFLLGIPIPLAALSAAALLLFTRRVKPEKVFRETDFTLLIFFMGLFIVTGAVKTTGLGDIISNVPTVLLFHPIIPAFPVPEEAWLTLAMASTFAGNLTLLGSVANLIIAESARKEGIHISFGEYLKAGIPITLTSLFAGVAILQ